MAITERAERERVTATAGGRLVGLRTMQDLFGWYASYFPLLSAKILGKLINDEYLRREAEKRQTARRMAQLAEDRRAKERNDPTSDENMRKLYPVVGKTPSAWKRDKITGPKEDRATLAEEDAHADEIEWSESEGEREHYPGERT